jgi:hypothetical protein
MMASSQCYTQAAVLRLNLSKNHNYITCFGIDLVDDMFDTAHLFNYAMMCSMPSHPVAIQPIFMAIVFSHFKLLTCISEELDRRDNPSMNQSEPESTRIPPPAHVPTKDKDI